MLNLYTVKDKASKTFIPPFAMHTDRDAIEGFRIVVSDKESKYHKFPEDFCLVKLGQFDEREGSFNTSDPQKLMEALDLATEDKKKEIKKEV